MIDRKQTGFFIGALCACVAICTILWESLVAQRIYICTDPGFLEFLAPGNWYHPQYGDTIREGWTQKTLFGLWFSMIVASVCAALALTLFLGKKPNHALARIPGNVCDTSPVGVDTEKMNAEIVRTGKEKMKPSVFILKIKFIESARTHSWWHYSINDRRHRRLWHYDMGHRKVGPFQQEMRTRQRIALRSLSD